MAFPHVQLPVSFQILAKRASSRFTQVQESGKEETQVVVRSSTAKRENTLSFMLLEMLHQSCCFSIIKYSTYSVSLLLNLSSCGAWLSLRALSSLRTRTGDAFEFFTTIELTAVRFSKTADENADADEGLTSLLVSNGDDDDDDDD